jgi:hypothetical protein
MGTYRFLTGRDQNVTKPGIPADRLRRRLNPNVTNIAMYQSFEKPKIHMISKSYLH